jgi:hypothetical protein
MGSVNNAEIIVAVAIVGLLGMFSTVKIIMIEIGHIVEVFFEVKDRCTKAAQRREYSNSPQRVPVRIDGSSAHSYNEAGNDAISTDLISVSQMPAMPTDSSQTAPAPTNPRSRKSHGRGNCVDGQARTEYLLPG